MRRACARAARTLAAVALAVAATTVPAAPQSASAADLQAAFVVNFARFTTWPPLPAGHPLVICVVGDARVARALTKTVRGQDMAGRPLTVTEVAVPSAIDGCQVLFVGGGPSSDAAAALLKARRRPILTIGDHPGFARETGIIELFIDGGRMRFAVNVENAGQAGLLISSRLLGLAKVVHGTEHN